MLHKPFSKFLLCKVLQSGAAAPDTVNQGSEKITGSAATAIAVPTATGPATCPFDPGKSEREHFPGMPARQPLPSCIRLPCHELATMPCQTMPFPSYDAAHRPVGGDHLE